MQPNQFGAFDHPLAQLHYRTTPKHIQNATLSPQNANPLEVDFVVRNVYQKIKSLENKYIDLANFYKESQQPPEESKLPPNSLSSLHQNSKQNLESNMIKDLIDQKRDLEENIQSLKTAVQQQKPESVQLQGNQKNVKRVLSLTFVEIQNQYEKAQSQTLQVLSQKQNEMFQIATKHKISSAFRNETLGLWYDTKSVLAQTFAEIKQQTMFFQHQAEQKLGLAHVYHPEENHQIALDHNQLNELNDLVFKFSRKQHKQRKEIKKIQSNFSKSSLEIQEVQKQAQIMLEEISCQLFTQDDSSLTRKKSFDRSVYLSPFQRKLNSQSNQALSQSVLSSQKRATSKGVTNQLKNQAISSTNNNQSKSSRVLQINDSGLTSLASRDQGAPRFQSDQLKQIIKQLDSQFNQQTVLSNDLMNCFENFYGESQSFTQSIQEIVSLQRPTNVVDSNERLQELQLNNEQLYNEVKICNEKYIDLRVENSKLRDQIFQLSNKQNSVRTPIVAPLENHQNQISDAQSHQSQDLLEQMCENVNKFMQAMRQLQKAVNRKDPDISTPKDNFEQTKVNLQGLVSHVREHLLSSKATSLRPVSADRNLGAGQQSPSKEKRQTVSSTQLNKLPLLLQNVKNLQLEKQKLQELIVELKQVHQFEIEKISSKSKSKAEKLQKYAAQCTVYQIKQQAQDQLLLDYKKLLLQQGSSGIELCQQRELQVLQKVREDIDRIQPNMKIDPQVQALRDELISQIKSQTQTIEYRVEHLNQQLKLKEDSLNRLKLLFVEKLHELETSFVEISHEVAETEQLQQQQAQQKRVPNQFEKSVENVLSKFENDDREKDLIELTQANQELLEQNLHLKQTMQLLTQQSKSSQGEAESQAQLELVIELQDQLDAQKQLFEKQVQKAKELEVSESALKKEIQTLKYDNKRNQFDFKDAKDRFEKAKSEFQAQFNGLKMTIISQKQQLEKEIELRQSSESVTNQLKKDISSLVAQKTFTDNENQNLNLELTQAKDQIQEVQSTYEQAQNDLNEQLQAVYQEMDAIRQQNAELQNQRPQEDNIQETQEMIDSYMSAIRKGTSLQIQNDDLTSIQSFKLFQAIQQEYLAILADQKELQATIQEQEILIQELKEELKDSTQEALENQLKLDKYERSLNSEQKDLSMSWQSQLRETQSLLEFKQKEIETMSEKLGRVNQEIGDYKLKFNRLEETYEELISQKALLQQRFDQSELQNEMIKTESNGEYEEYKKVTDWTIEQYEIYNKMIGEVSVEITRPIDFQTTLVTPNLQLCQSIEHSIKIHKDKILNESDRNPDSAHRQIISTNTNKQVIVSSILDSYSKLLNLLQNYNRQIDKLYSQHKQTDQQHNLIVSELQNRIQSIDEILSNHTEQGKVMAQTIRELEANLLVSQSELQESNEKLSDLKSNSEENAVSKAHFEKMKNDYQVQFNGLKGTIVTMKQQVDKQNELRKIAEETSTSLRTEISSLENQKAQSEKQIKSLNQDLADEKNKIIRLELNFQQEKNEINDKLQALQKTIEQVELQNADLLSYKSNQADPKQTKAIIDAHLKDLLSGTRHENNQNLTLSQALELNNELQNQFIRLSETSKQLQATVEEQQSKIQEYTENRIELLAKIKHANSMIVVEKEHFVDLEAQLKQKEANFAQQLKKIETEYSEKMAQAQKLVESVKQEGIKNQEQSQTQIAESLKQEQKSKQDLEQKYKSEMKAFLQKAVEDRKRIQSEYDEQINTLKNHTEQIQKDSQTNIESHKANSQQEMKALMDKHSFETIQLQGQIEALKANLAESDEKIKSLVQSKQYEVEKFDANKNISNRQFQLALALKDHLKKQLIEKFKQLNNEYENMQIFTQNLEENVQKTEFKQVQLMGDLKSAQDELKKYKQDANKLLSEGIKRQSDLKKSEEAKDRQIKTLLDIQDNLQQQVEDYATQLQKLEDENAQNFERASELESELYQTKGQLNLKEHMLDQALSPKQQSPAKMTILEMKIQELQGFTLQQEEIISQLRADLQRLNKPNSDRPEEKRNSWEFNNSGGRGSWGSNGATASAEVEEQLKHIRQIMIQFLVKLPFTSKENEEILPILFSMLNFKEVEIESVTQQREELNKEIAKEKEKAASKNIFGFGKKSSKKN